MKYVGVGIHTVLDLYLVDPNSMIIINNCTESKTIWNEFMERWFLLANFTPINTVWQDFDSVGWFTVVYVCVESQISIRTWPDKHYVSIDIFATGACDADYMASQLIDYFAPKYKTEKKLVRGEMVSDSV